MGMAVMFIESPNEYSIILSSILVFVAVLVSMFSSFGSGICLVTLSLAAVSCYHFTRRLPFLLRLASLPFCTFSFWLKLFLYITEHDTAVNYKTLVFNNYFINLMIVPAVLVLHVQFQKKD